MKGGDLSAESLCCVLQSMQALRPYVFRWIRSWADLEGQEPLLAEAGAVGQKGLSINNPEQNHHLQHYRGGTDVSALQVVCVLYVGVQLLLPGQDAGIDFAREYELAEGLVDDKPDT